MQTFFKILLYLLLATFTLFWFGASLSGLCLFFGTCVPYREHTFYAGASCYLSACFVLFFGAVFGIM